MSVIVATAYMDEAQRFDWLAAMDAGKVIATGSPAARKAACASATAANEFSTTPSAAASGVTRPRCASTRGGVPAAKYG